MKRKRLESITSKVRIAKAFRAVTEFAERYHLKVGTDDEGELFIPGRRGGIYFYKGTKLGTDMLVYFTDHNGEGIFTFAPSSTTATLAAIRLAGIRQRRPDAERSK